MSKLSQQEIIPLPTDLGALGNRINHGTREAHNKIDKMMMIMFGLAIRDAKIYRQGLQSFYHVFDTVEKCLDRQIKDGKPEHTEYTTMLSKIYKPEIRRTEKLRQDLLFYYNGHEEKFADPVMPEQIKFAQHIQQVSAEKPYLLLAYLHVMYLALFAGGRIMRSKLTQASGLFPQVDGKTTAEVSKLGTNFFTFDVEDENVFRVLYKRDYELLTRNSLTEEQKLEIIAESQYIFEQNGKCVKEIEARNLLKLKSKMAYKAAFYGYYVLILLAVAFVAYFSRRLLNNFLA
ncbi:hypothetical protein BABINDRAFT_179216 [Babjeviella inositovora NRRL Y-12698]|uniref:Heme oxygenase n=1 Tax=Babjeviella inositovora NRRL Y-12698 TaxID=984486 RepID=A0A1E3QV64_9ASCO|nr:uncharacterized protein BABINDRAFT_179216 [Babjeviella inositovora NRRL Y-12698]ODQ81494.1 hypothetical protein BABINDRAFT_179216 [Babjeviella inositovora NRRL Y-12698]